MAPVTAEVKITREVENFMLRTGVEKELGLRALVLMTQGLRGVKKDEIGEASDFFYASHD
jgi:hypothetical protein